MATTTPNNGWAVPTSTDYVKDGATAIETLGDAIDTSVGTGLLAWTSYTPVLTSQTGSITSYTVNTAKYVRLGKIGILRFSITITNNGTGATSNFITLPAGFTPLNVNNYGTGRENAIVGFQVQINIAGSPLAMRVVKFDGTYAGATNHELCGTIVMELT
jgi:hypothetical protein